MTVSTNHMLQEALRRLLERLDTIQKESDAVMENAQQIAAGLDKLAEVVANLEFQRNQENKLLNKLETLARQLEKIDSCQAEKPVKKGFERSFRTLVAGTKTVGQVLEIVANGIQVMMDSIVQALNEFYSSSPKKASS
ncbi:MAG: hypothetical protein AB1652_06550 [Bacillota bacterium]